MSNCTLPSRALLDREPVLVRVQTQMQHQIRLVLADQRRDDGQDVPVGSADFGKWGQDLDGGVLRVGRREEGGYLC